MDRYHFTVCRLPPIYAPPHWPREVFRERSSKHRRSTQSRSESNFAIHVFVFCITGSCDFQNNYNLIVVLVQYKNIHVWLYCWSTAFPHRPRRNWAFIILWYEVFCSPLIQVDVLCNQPCVTVVFAVQSLNPWPSKFCFSAGKIIVRSRIPLALFQSL